MDHSICGFSGLNADLVVDIMSRLDGPSVASVSCACSDLCEAAQDQKLWTQACNAVWPSTSLPETQSLIKDFKRFYAESYPLVLCYGENPDRKGEVSGEPALEMEPAHNLQDFISLIDVYYGKRCILSQASLPESGSLNKVSNEGKSRGEAESVLNLPNTWLANYPFRWQVLEFPQSHDEGYAADTDAEHEPEQRDLQTKLELALRLSWVLINKKTGKSVNLSSWKPIFSRRGWAIDGGEYMLQFGCIVPADKSLSPQQMVKCTIVVNCKINGQDPAPILGEINLHMEDSTGKHLNGNESLTVLNQALVCSRSINKSKIEQGIAYYWKKKRDFMKKKQLQESVAVGIFASVQVAVLVALVYVFIKRFM